MQLLFSNITSILGFGFLGLSFVFVYLAYTNVREVIQQDDPSDAAQNLSKFFMTISLVFMIAAGPLQWLTIWIDSKVREQEATLIITMTHTDWDFAANGQIHIVDEGNPIQLINKPFTKKFKDGAIIELDAGMVAAAIRIIQAQVATLNARAAAAELDTASPGNIRPSGSAVITNNTRGMLDGG